MHLIYPFITNTTSSMAHNQIYVTVDSAERDNFQITSPSEYVYRLPYTLRNVNSIELMTFQMTRAEPNLYDAICAFSVTIGPSTTQCTIVGGETPTIEDFRSRLENSLRAVDTDFNVSYSAVSNRFTISFNAPFSMNVPAGLARMIGVVGDGYRGGGNVSSGASQQIVGTKAVDLKCEPYVLMYVNDYDRMKGVSTPLQKSFIMVPFEDRTWMTRFVMCNDEKEKKGIYTLTNNQTTLYEMRIRFTRPDGTLYDFHGIDHQIVFRVTRSGGKDYTT